MLTFGSLFAGIGGFDLGLERAGMACKWQVEIDDYATRILEKHWPGVKRYRDIRDINGSELEPVDLICGGFPCQDISCASATAVGIVGSRSGLWSEFRRILAAVRPKYALIENVPALRGRGLALVLQDLWALGFDAEWHCIPACAVGAPHERDRIWIVAYTAGTFKGAAITANPESERFQGRTDQAELEWRGSEERRESSGSVSPDTDCIGCDGRSRESGASGGANLRTAVRENADSHGQRCSHCGGGHPTQSNGSSRDIQSDSTTNCTTKPSGRTSQPSEQGTGGAKET